MYNRTKEVLLLIAFVGIGFTLFFLNFQRTKEPEKVIEPPMISEPEKTSYLNDIKGKKLEEPIQQAIIQYMDIYYASMKNLEEKDMTFLFDDPNGEQALINQTALSLLIQIRKIKPNDLTLSSARYDLNVQEVGTIEDGIKIVVRENSYLRFHLMDDIESKIYGIENTFVLRKIDNQYKISQYSKTQDFFVMITDQYSKGGKEQLNIIKNNYLAIIEKNIVQDRQSYQAFLKEEDFHPKICDHSYDRDKALEYAKKWVTTRNTNEWSKFDANCQNYASQVVYSGGIPMDYKGNAIEHLQWKFYDPSYNEKQVASGYLYTWTYVPYFYTYAKNNTGLGMCADVDVNIYYAEAGDIIHVGTNLTNFGPGRHALVSIGPYKKDNQVVDILVNSNTVDLEDYPLSAYVYPYVSLIKIYGYND